MKSIPKSYTTIASEAELACPCLTVFYNLPPSLEELALPCLFYVMEEEDCNLQEGGKFTWIEDLLYERPWVEELVYLVQNSASKFRRLRKITVLDWNSSIDWPGKECKAARRLTGIWRLRVESHIPFLMLKETSQWQTLVPYFLEILQTRNPGCEDWRGVQTGNGPEELSR